MKFQNVKVPADINKYLSSLTFTDEDEDNADDLQLAFDDRERKWLGSWLEVKPTFIKTTTTVQKQVEAASVVNYVVKKGDTLWAIAKKYLGSGTKYPQIASENNIKNPNLIYPGQVFKITTGGTATQTVTETKETTKKVSDPKLITATIVQKNWHDNGKDAVLDCGTFELDSVDASGPPTKITLKGTSIPYTSKMRVERKSKAWENTNLKVIAEQIASESNLKLMYIADNIPKYKRKEQVQTSDIVFLQKLCKAAGLALKVTTMNVVIYDAAEYDSKPPIKTIKYGSGEPACMIQHTPAAMFRIRTRTAKKRLKAHTRQTAQREPGKHLKSTKRSEAQMKHTNWQKNGYVKRTHSSLQQVSQCLVMCSWWQVPQSN